MLNYLCGKLALSPSSPSNERSKKGRNEMTASSLHNEVPHKTGPYKDMNHLEDLCTADEVMWSPVHQVLHDPYLLLEIFKHMIKYNKMRIHGLRHVNKVCTLWHQICTLLCPKVDYMTASPSIYKLNYEQDDADCFLGSSLLSLCLLPLNGTVYLGKASPSLHSVCLSLIVASSSM